MRARLTIAVMIAGVVFGTGPAAAETCKTIADAYVHNATQSIYDSAARNNPSVRKMPVQDFVVSAGHKFLAAPKPEYKAFGYMMLLWYGGKADRDAVAEAGAELETEAERAHFYFVMGLYSIGSKTPAKAAEGRSYIRQMKDSGYIAFVEDAMWDQLLKGCELAK